MKPTRAQAQLQLGQFAALTGYAAFGFPTGENGQRIAPTEFRVFAAGTFDTTKGDYHFTARSAEATMSLYRSRGNPLMGDYEHQTDAPALGFPPMEAPASITDMVPEIRIGEGNAPELWVTQVQWTARAKAMLEAGEYRLFSPAFTYDKETREVLGLKRIALTNDPAMNFLEPLVAATAGTTEQETIMDPTAPTACAKCTATDAHLATLKAANEQLLADHQKLLTDHQKIVGDHQALMGNHQAVTAQLKSFEDWAAEEAEEHEDGESTLTATLTASFGGKKPETQVVLAALSNKRKTLATFRKDVLEIAGGKDGDTVVGTLTAWKSQSEELVATKATVEKERTERLTSDFKSKLTALSTGKAPRITPAHRKACEELLTNKGLEAAQQALSVLAPGDTGPAIVATEEIPQPGANQDQMIPEAIKFCTASNIDPKAFVKSGVYLQSAEYKDAVERLGRR